MAVVMVPKPSVTEGLGKSRILAYPRVREELGVKKGPMV